MYALGIIPLIQRLADCEVSQTWYVEYCFSGRFPSGSSLLVGLFDSLWTQVWNTTKTCLIVKSQHRCKARALFQGMGVVITDDGKHHPGSALDTDEFWLVMCETRGLRGWGRLKNCQILLSLNHKQLMRPSHMCFCTIGCILLIQYRCLMTCTVLLMRPQAFVFLLILTGQLAFGPTKKELLSLPARLGGLGVIVPFIYF